MKEAYALRITYSSASTKTDNSHTGNNKLHIQLDTHTVLYACSLNEENVDLLSHQESDHKQLKADNNELRYNLEELKLKLKQ